MYYLGKQLVSGECNDSVNLLQQHIPATAASPTYVLPLPTLKLEASSKGMVTTPTESVMLAQSEGDFSEYFLQQINPDFTTGIRRNIPGDGSRGLQIAGYKQGFILYDKSLATFDYYQNINSSPQRILLEKPTNTKLTRYKASVHDDAITVLSANIPVGDQGLNPNSDPTEIQKIDGGLSEVVMFRDGKQKHFTFNLSFRSVDACGTNKLCAIDNSGLAVYDLATKKPKVLYRIDGATDIHTVASSVQVVTSSGVITLNPDTGNGHYSYSYGGYSNCGIFTTAPHGYVLCIANKKGSRAALYVDVSKNNSDSIDKKILKLSEAQNVKSVSVTQDTIYVVPDYGELVYNPETNLNTHDPATVKSIDRSIDSAIQKSEIDRKIYMIQNLGKID